MPTNDLSRRAFLRLDWLRVPDQDGDTAESAESDELDGTVAEESVDPRGSPSHTDVRRSEVDDRSIAD
jgi:hypothetical protein